MIIQKYQLILKYSSFSTQIISRWKGSHNPYKSRYYEDKKKWRYVKPKPGLIDPKSLSITEPISGSKILPNYNDVLKVNTDKWEFQTDSLSKRGFLRFQKSYEPSENVISQILGIARQTNPELSTKKDEELIDYKLDNPRFKYDFLYEINRIINHAVPNSMLHMITSIGHACKFYNTSVNTRTPYDDLQRRKDLPKNLHIQMNPLRFSPETDTLFGGVSAFPQSSTIVSGLRAKKKYKSFYVNRGTHPQITD